MNIRKLTVLFFTMGFVMLISGGFSSFLINLREDHKTVLRRMEDVSAVFESFSTNTTFFEEYRDTLYTEVLENVYYDTMYSSEPMVKEKLNDYSKLVDALTEGTKKLDELCEDVYYPKSDANNMCVNYKSIYEQVVNYYVSDVEAYNSNVSKYNAYQKAIQSDKIVSEYKIKYHYVDYNGDNKFDGREE